MTAPLSFLLHQCSPSSRRGLPRDSGQDPGAARTSPHPIHVQAHLLQPHLNHTGPLPRPPSHSECDHVAWEPTRRLHAP